MAKEKVNQPITFEGVIFSLEDLSEHYRIDPEMSSDRALLYIGWLDKTVGTVKELSSEWSQALKETFAQTATNLLKTQYFRHGTKYGTGYGARPLVEISRSLKHFSFFTEEETIGYLKLLEEIYTSPQFRPSIVDPLCFFEFSGSEQDKKFIQPLVKELTRRLEKAADSTLERKREITIISSFVDITRKAVTEGRKIPGFIFLNGKQILEWLKIPYKKEVQEPSLQTTKAVFLEGLEEGLYPLERLFPQIRETLMAKLKEKAEAVADNYSEYETPGLSETTLNNELIAIWREIEEIFYQTLAKELP